MFKTNNVVSKRIVKTLIIKYGIYASILAEKMQKLLTFFSKNTCELDILLTRTINILTTNERVKLTMLRTTGSRCSHMIFSCEFSGKPISRVDV